MDMVKEICGSTNGMIAAFLVSVSEEIKRRALVECTNNANAQSALETAANKIKEASKTLWDASVIYKM
jgi:hypothetical protein